MRKILFVFIFILSFSCSKDEVGDPQPQSGGDEIRRYDFLKDDYLHTYLTWTQEKMNGNQTIVFHHPFKVFTNPIVHYGESEATSFQDLKRTRSPFIVTDGPFDRKVYFVRLEELDPDKTYYFTIVDENVQLKPVQKFKTLPKKDKEVTFVIGGDVGPGSDTLKMIKTAAKKSPAFAFLGGDLAYANGTNEWYFRWEGLLKDFQENFIDPEGHLIPIMPIIGNHEVNKQRKSPHYNSLFHPNEKTYFKRYLGDHTVFFALDTGHIADYDGPQKAWMKKQFKKHRRKWENRIAIYHIPLYPSIRELKDEPGVQLGRDHWAPLFDKYDITVAFEHHDHAFKRSKKIRGNVEDPKGIYYLGDGAWGRLRVASRLKKKWWIEKSASFHHVWFVTASKKNLKAKAVSKEDSLIDSVLIR